jgi:hypothetical protein
MLGLSPEPYTCLEGPNQNASQRVRLERTNLGNRGASLASMRSCVQTSVPPKKPQNKRKSLLIIWLVQVKIAIHFHKYLVNFIFFFGSTGGRTQDPASARQVLYHLRPFAQYLIKFLTKYTASQLKNSTWCCPAGCQLLPEDTGMSSLSSQAEHVLRCRFVSWSHFQYSASTSMFFTPPQDVSLEIIRPYIDLPLVCFMKYWNHLVQLCKETGDQSVE